MNRWTDRRDKRNSDVDVKKAEEKMVNVVFECPVIKTSTKLRYFAKTTKLQNFHTN